MSWFFFRIVSRIGGIKSWRRIHIQTCLFSFTNCSNVWCAIIISSHEIIIFMQQIQAVLRKTTGLFAKWNLRQEQEWLSISIPLPFQHRCLLSTNKELPHGLMRIYDTKCSQFPRYRHLTIFVTDVQNEEELGILVVGWKSRSLNMVR